MTIMVGTLGAKLAVLGLLTAVISAASAQQAPPGTLARLAASKEADQARKAAAELTEQLGTCRPALQRDKLRSHHGERISGAARP